jgi:hypothetical protein
MKTKPERQYDIFLVKGEDPTPPEGSQLLTTYDSKLGGHWAIQYTALNPGYNVFGNISPPTVPSWNESSD